MMEWVHQHEGIILQIGEGCECWALVYANIDVTETQDIGFSGEGCELASDRGNKRKGSDNDDDKEDQGPQGGHTSSQSSEEHQSNITNAPRKMPKGNRECKSNSARDARRNLKYEEAVTARV
jgi:hypothetical protein